MRMTTEELSPLREKRRSSHISIIYDFRPTGSPTAANNNISSARRYSYAHVIVISLDFSRAFDTVRHANLLGKVAQFDMPDEV